MNWKPRLGPALLGGTLLFGVPLLAAPFQNLDFEAVRTPLVPDPNDTYHRVPLSDAFPGWTGFAGTNLRTLVLTTNAFLASAGISLWGPQRAWQPFGLDGGSIDGRYTAFLQNGADLSSNERNAVSASLSQIGLVPSDAQSVRLKIYSVGPFSVSLGSEPLELVPLHTTTNFTLFAGDVTAFAGQTSELRISSDVWLGPTGFGYLWLDSISFSTEPVPEPSTVALLLAGGMLLARRWRTARQR